MEIKLTDKIEEFKFQIKNNELKDGIKYIQQLNQEYPENILILQAKSHTYFIEKNKDQEEFINTCKNLLKEDKENKTLLNILGNIHLINKDYEESIEYYKRTLKQYRGKLIKEHHVISALTGLYNAYDKIKDKKQRKKNYEKLLKLYNNDKTQILNQAQKLNQEIEYIETYKIYNTLLYNDKKNMILNLKKADLYTHINKNKKAIKIHKQILQEHPDNINTICKKAMSLVKINQEDKGEENFKKILEINKNNADAIYGLGYIENKKGHIKEALKYYNQALEENQYHIPSLLKKAEIEKSEKEYEKSINTYNKILNKDKTNYQALKGKSENYKNLKKYQEELNTINIILKENPYNIKGIKQKIQCLENLNKNEEAYKLSKTLLELEPLEKNNKKLVKRLENKKTKKPSLLDNIKNKFKR